MAWCTRIVISLALSLLLGTSARAAGLPPTRARDGRLWQLIEAETAQLYEAPAAQQWFEQRVDHFDSSTNATFQQRYYEVDSFWRAPDGPVILSIGGEGSLDRAPQGFIQLLAQRFGAKILALEHRYYGQSIPNKSLSTDNYRFLTVQQALADLAHFREWYQRGSMPAGQDTKWLAIGGSYPGALSAWFRVAYPNVTTAALSSSGVVLPVLSFHEFDEQVATAAGERCSDVLRQTTAAFEHELQHGNGSAVKALFGSRADMWEPDFFYMLADSAAMAVQYGHKDVLCNTMVGAADRGASLIDTFARFTIDMYGAEFGNKCFYDTACLANDTSRWVGEGDDRSWRWQKCAQLAYFQVAPDTGSLRSSVVDLAYHKEQCRAIFGDVVNPSRGVEEVKKLYGGDHPPGHNIFFSNGADDPWQRASVVKTLGDDEVANLAECDLCGHCGDLGGNPNVPEPLKKQREEIITYLSRWMGISSEVLNGEVASAAIVVPDGHRSSPLVLVPIVLAFAVLVMVIHADIVVRDAPARRFPYDRLATHEV